MNKKLIALAVAGACVAPAAMAQTANPVTLYGKVYVTLESVDTGGSTAGTLPRRNRVSDQASRIGVRGTEDLGGGLKAFFQLETVFKADQNDSTFANRNSGVGLQGGWGTFLMGRWDTPLKVVANAMDPFGDVTGGAQASVLLGSGVAGVVANFDTREQNVVQYWSPSWAGFAVRLSYMANEGRTTGATAVNPRSEGGSLTYTGGPIYVGYAYHQKKDTAFGTLASGGSALAPATQKLNALMGTFTFGPVKIGGMYNKIERTGFSEQKAWLANVVWTLGNNQIIYQHQDGKDGARNDLTANQPSCKNDSIGWQYNFSRRTFWLLEYTKIENNDTGTCNFASTPGPLTTAIAGQDVKALQMGISHSF